MSKTRICLAASVCCSDDFRELSHEAQALYLALCFEADNDGVIDSVRSLMRATTSESEALDELLETGHLLRIDSRHVVTHWWVNNKKDSINYRPGNHQDVVSLIEQISEQNRAYRLIEDNQSDISLTSVANISEAKQNENKISETKESEFKPKEGKKNPIDSMHCPHCEKLAATSPQGNILYGECMYCGYRFFFDPETGEFTDA